MKRNNQFALMTSTDTQSLDCEEFQPKNIPKYFPPKFCEGHVLNDRVVRRIVDLKECNECRKLKKAVEKLAQVLNIISWNRTRIYPTITKIPFVTELRHSI